MKQLRMVLAIALAVGACSKKPAPAVDTGSGSGAPTAVVVAADAAEVVVDAAAAVTGPVDAPTSGPIPLYTPAASTPDAIKAAVTATDRTDDDRRLDAGRKPAEVLAFFGVAPGQKIGELFAGGGYTSELLARVVGEKGALYAENTKELMDKFIRAPWIDRMTHPAMAHVTGVELPIDAPFPAEAKDLDAVITILNYHDVSLLGADPAKMNAAVFAALKKGGVYGIVDSSAQAGSGRRDSDSFHRIDEALVTKEVEAAGFKLAASSDVLRNPGDKRDWSSSPKAAGERRGTSDRFVLKFVKP